MPTPGPPYEPSGGQMIARGLARRCPRCGGGGLFEGWFTMRERCPGCHLKLAREDAHFVGAMAINLVVTEIAFGILLVTWAAATWPKPPWVSITLTAVAMNAVLPVLLYPFSKSVWTALDLWMHRFDPVDRTEIELP